MARLIFAAALLLTGCDHCAKVCDIKPADAPPALSEDTPSGHKVLEDLRTYNEGSPPPPNLLKTYCQPKWTQVLAEHCSVVVDKLCENKCKDADTTERCKKEERDEFVHSCAERSVGPFKQALTKCASVTGINASNNLTFP